MSVPVSTTLTFPPTRPASLWDAFGDPPERQWPGCAGTHCSWQDSTSSWGAPSTSWLPQAHLGLCCPFQQHYSREMLSISTLVFRPFTGKNDSKITNTSWLQSAQCYTNTLTSKVLPGRRDAEDRRLKTCSKVRLKSLPCFTVSGKTLATFLKTSTLQEVKITLQACLVVCAALKG